MKVAFLKVEIDYRRTHAATQLPQVSQHEQTEQNHQQGRDATGQHEHVDGEDHGVVADHDATAVAQRGEEEDVAAEEEPEERIDDDQPVRQTRAFDQQAKARAFRGQGEARGTRENRERSIVHDQRVPNVQACFAIDEIVILRIRGQDQGEKVADDALGEYEDVRHAGGRAEDRARVLAVLCSAKDEDGDEIHHDADAE